MAVTVEAECYSFIVLTEGEQYSQSESAVGLHTSSSACRSGFVQTKKLRQGSLEMIPMRRNAGCSLA